eukprot:93214_1
MSVAIFVVFSLLFKKCKAQCLVDTGSCDSNVVQHLWNIDYVHGKEAPHTFIQTFDVSPCVSDKQLEISEVSIWFNYYISSTVSIDFTIELFIPSSLNALGPTDAYDIIGTAQTHTSLTNTMSATRKRVRFSNLNITLGCNSRFAMYVYPLNCNGNDPGCGSTTALKRLYLYACSIPVGQETFFDYYNNANDPLDLAFIDTMSPETEMADWKMDVDIVYRDTTLCIHTTGTQTETPTKASTKTPTESPSKTPTEIPTKQPTNMLTSVPTRNPSRMPTLQPTSEPTPSPINFADAEVNPYHSTSLNSETSANENRSTVVDPIMMVVVIIISLVVALSVVYCIYKYHSTKKMTGQTITAMEASNDAAVDDIVNCNIQDTEKKAGEGSQGTDKPLSGEGVQTAVYNPKLVMCGSVKLTKGQSEPAVEEPMQKGEEDNSSATISDDLYEVTSQPKQATDGLEAPTCEGPKTPIGSTAGDEK